MEATKLFFNYYFLPFISVNKNAQEVWLSLSQSQHNHTLVLTLAAWFFGLNISEIVKGND